VSIKQNGILDFGANTRQMINLWDSNYGIGVQASTTYFRSDSDFCWFMGGTHSDSECDSGSFGFTPMGLFPGPYQLPSAAMARLHVVGDIVADFAVYAQAFKSLSDRNAKTEIEPVEARAILSRVVELPISSWVFKTDPQTRHIGPMAQDFAAAFRIGTDDTHIAAVDAEGVAFAAIQGLHLLVQEKDAKIDELQNDLRAQRSELMRLQQAVDAFTARSAAVDAIDRGR
jgi:hypothetical protein